jgi:ribosomal protein S18 acetylase RimI-like enzyme
MNNKSKLSGTEFENIIFFEDDKTPLVRTLKPEQQDFSALARCYNSFKDSDSWPGGFGGSFVFTGEYLEEQMANQDLSSKFIIVAPDDKAKIVGVSMCSKNWNLPDAWYVQLLGVDPKYQGQKLGKALLLYSTKFAMEKNARLISLHTWGGNLKALPLYKKQGYKWRPNTAVYMENYIPQILNFPQFTTFFSKYSWYDIYKPVINQETDEEFDEKMHVYEYYFEQDKENSIKTWIDRSIGKISGFHYKSDDVDFLVQARTPNSEAFIGIEDFPVTLYIKNNGQKGKSVSINASPTSKIELVGPQNQEMKLKAGEEKTIQYTASFVLDTEEHDQKIFTHDYSEHQITFTITSDNLTFPINVGKIPLDAIRILTYPQNYTVNSNQEISIPLSVTNNLGKESEIEINVTNSKNITCKENIITTKVSKFDSIAELPVKINETNTTVDYLEIIAKTKDGEDIHKAKIPIPIFNENRTVVYYFEDQIFIENKYYRLCSYKKPIPGNNEIIILDKLRKLQIKGNALQLGYPFDEESSEFYSKLLTHEVKETTTGVWLLSSSESEKKSGIKITREVFIPHANEPIGIQMSIENLSDETIENLGVLKGSYWWPGQHPFAGVVLPYKDGIAQYTLSEISATTEKKPSELSEGWKATKYQSGIIGFLFDLDKLQKINFDRRFPSFEFKAPALKPKTTYTSPMTWYCFADTWQQIRKLWLDKYHPSPDNKAEFHLEAKPNKQFGIMLTDSSTICRGLILSKNHKELDVAFTTIGTASLKGTIKVETKGNNLPKTKTSIDDPKVKLWKEAVQIKSTEPMITNGKITYDCNIRKYQTPIALAFFDSEKKVKISKGKQDGKEYYQVDNGFLKYRGSKDQRGHIYYLTADGSDENLLLTFFPEIKPFMWVSEFHGGIGGIVHPSGMWIGEQDFYNKLTFDMFEVTNGPWKGIGVKTSIIDYTPALKGIQMSLNCLTLPNSPLVLIQQRVTNHSKVPRRCYIDMGTSINVSKSSKDKSYYTSTEGEILTLSMHEYESRSWRDKKKNNKWVAYKKHGSKNYIGLVTLASNYGNDTYAYTPNLSFMRLGRDVGNLTIKPGETVTLYDMFVITDDLANIEPFTESNILDLLEDK